jgi:hypothetical protein
MMMESMEEQSMLINLPAREIELEAQLYESGQGSVPPTRFQDYGVMQVLLAILFEIM